MSTTCPAHPTETDAPDTAPTGVTRLPLALVPHSGGRSAMTCRYRCGDACSRQDGNDTDNEYFGDIVTSALSRRSFLQVGAGTAGAVSLGVWGATAPAAAAPAAAPADLAAAEAAAAPAASAGSSAFGRLFPAGFAGISPIPATTDAVVVPKGWAWKPLISWGDPLFDDAPGFSFGKQSAAAQAKQFGYNNDYTTLIRRSAREALLVCNHEYTNDELMFAGVTEAKDLSDEQLRIIMAAHGMSVVDVRRRGTGSPWRYVRGGAHNRRIHTHTPFAVTGPAAGHSLLKTKADPTGRRVLGTLNNCAGGTTPWGTVLSGEENVDQYFNAKNAPKDRLETLLRYTTDTEGRGWERVDSRFDVGVEPNAVHPFGWVVEDDPSDPRSTPRKHTALGRFKHEGATVAIDDDGTVSVYSGDDSRFEYLYKFVSHRKYRAGSSRWARKHNLEILTSGDLYVAKFTGDGTKDGEFDGSGRWLPLVKDGKSAVPGMSLEEVLIYTRLAGDKVGATKMDRPEDVETNPVNGRVYMACTNNTKRTPSQVDEANPRPDNKHGHIVEIAPRGGRHASDHFGWKLVLVAGDPKDPTTYFNGFDKTKVTSISCPDNVTFDSRGNLWISTDGQPGTLKHCDGLFMMPLEGPAKGKLRQFLSVPVGAETCGPVITFDERAILVAVQHPGEVDGATAEKPASRFPYRGDKGPRPSVIQAYRA